MSALAEELPVELDGNGNAPSGDDPGEQGWRKDKTGRWFTPARGRSGVVYRAGNETLEEAHARDSKGPKDRRPKAKPKAKVPPAPTQTSLIELEHELAQALSAPSMIVAGLGDEWAANHFTREGPILARNLVSAAKYNPWLRAKLEAAAFAGDDMLIRLIMTMGLAGALFGYCIPPIVYYLDPPFISARARELYQIPRREKQAKPDRGDHGAERPSSPAPAAGTTV